MVTKLLCLRAAERGVTIIHFYLSSYELHTHTHRLRVIQARRGEHAALGVMRFSPRGSKFGIWYCIDEAFFFSYTR